MQNPEKKKQSLEFDHKGTTEVVHMDLGIAPSMCQGSCSCPPPASHLPSPHPSPPLPSLLPHTPVMCRYTLGWLLFHDRLLLPGAETHLIVNIWAITIAN